MANSFKDLPGETSKEKAAHLIRLIDGGLNTLGETGFSEAIAKEIPRMHRTLQQRLMRDLVIPIINTFADLYDEDRYDARNEATCVAAAELRKVLENHGFPTI